MKIFTTTLIQKVFTAVLLTFFAVSTIQVNGMESNPTVDEFSLDFGCQDNWTIMIYDLPYLKGRYRCFSKGEYYAGRDCANYYGRQISIRVRDGYAVCFYDRHGKLIKRVTGEVTRYPYGFTKFCVLAERETGHGQYAQNDPYQGGGHHNNGGHSGGHENGSYQPQDHNSGGHPAGGRPGFVNTGGQPDGGGHHPEGGHPSGGRPGFLPDSNGGGQYPPEQHPTPDYQPECSPYWAIRIYEHDYFKGNYKCFKEGEYLAGHCDKYRGQRISFRLKQGYYAYFYDRYGKLVRKCGGDMNYFPQKFHKFSVHKGTPSGRPARDPYAPKKENCFDDWAVQIYDQHQYRGQQHCYKTGDYFAGKHCPSYVGRKISIKVRKGYYVCFYDRYGKLIRKCSNNINYYPYGFYKFCVRKVEYGNHGHDYGNSHGGDDWAIKIWERDRYQGQHKAFKYGEYEAGHCAKYFGQRISFKIKKGYYVCFYDRYGKLIRKCHGEVGYFPNKFNKFCVRKY